MTKENLIPFDKLTQEEQRKIASEGGKASGRARAARRKFEDQIDSLFRVLTKFKVEEVKQMFKKQGLTEEQEKILEAASEVLKEGGAEMMLVMETLLSKKASISNKMITLFQLLEHRYGKARQFNEFSGPDGEPLTAPTIVMQPIKTIDHDTNKV